MGWMAGAGESFGRSPDAILVLMREKLWLFRKLAQKNRNWFDWCIVRIGSIMRQSPALPLLPSLVSLLRVPLAAVSGGLAGAAYCGAS